MYRQEQVHRLVALIYEAALDPSQWPRFLEVLGETIHGHILVLSSINSKPQLNIQATGRADPEFFEIYARDYRDHDPWLTAAHARGILRAGRVKLGEEIVPRDELRKTAYFADLTPRYKSFGGMAAIIANPDSLGGLSAHQTRFDQFGAAEVALFETLAPHVERALQLHHRIAGLQQQRDDAADVLDRMPTAIILVSASGRPVLMNASAVRLLKQADGLKEERGALVAGNAAETRTLRSLVAASIRTSGGAGLSSGGVMRVTRADPRPPLQVLVSPLRTGVGLEVAAPSAAAVIFAHDPARTPPVDGETLVRLYGLTRAEARIATALAEALPPIEIARTLGISVHTVRTHLGRIFDKTGAEGQTQLLQLLLSGPAAIIHVGDAPANRRA